MDVCSIVQTRFLTDTTYMNKTPNTPTLTKDQAIEKANLRAWRAGTAYAVIERTDHPAYPGQTVYMIAPRSNVYRLSPGSTIIHVSPA